MSHAAIVVAPGSEGTSPVALRAPTYESQGALTHPGSLPPATFATPTPTLTCVCFPEPSRGRHPPTQASTNFLKRPTVTSYLSRRKAEIVAGKFAPAMRSKVPPGTRRLLAHESVPLAPQSERPAPVIDAVAAESSLPGWLHADAPGPDTIPEPHAAQLPAFAVLEYVPGVHGTQFVSAEAVPRLARKEPGGQTLQSAQLAAFCTDANLPLGHGEHARFNDELGVLFANSPGLHVLHGEQLPAFVDAEYDATPHAEQERSAVALPWVLTYSPATQTVQGAHWAAFVTVLNEPDGHSLHAAPLEYVPGSQSTRVPESGFVPASTSGIPPSTAPSPDEPASPAPSCVGGPDSASSIGTAESPAALAPPKS